MLKPSCRALARASLLVLAGAVLLPVTAASARVLNGTRHADRLIGTPGRDTLRGGPGNDHLDGRGGRDRLEGGSGRDTILADGEDLVNAGPGADRVVLTVKSRLRFRVDCGSGRDTLTIRGTTAARATLRARIRHCERVTVVRPKAPAVPGQSAAPGAPASSSPPSPASTAAASIPGPPPGCTANTTPQTFAAAFAAAQPGQTVCLASGSYGTFAGAAKPGPVTVQGAAGATASMSLALSAASNVVVDNVTVTGGAIQGRSTNITVADSNFTGLFLIETSTPSANILLARNQHVNLDAPPDGLPARVTVWSSGHPSGVTIANSLFKGGDADGVRPDGDQVQVLGNEFADIMDVGANHADPIQFYGATRAIVKGNYFHNSGGNTTSYIMQADGGQGNVIEDNVFAAVNGGPGGGHGVGYGITLNSDSGSIIDHNTFQPGTCDFSLPCGEIAISNKSGDPAGSGTVIRDNIFGGIIGGQGTYSSDHNLLTTSTRPSFVGPLTGYAGFHLMPGSAGTTAASDGGAVGIH